MHRADAVTAHTPGTCLPPGSKCFPVEAQSNRSHGKVGKPLKAPTQDGAVPGKGGPAEATGNIHTPRATQREPDKPELSEPYRTGMRKDLPLQLLQEAAR